MGEKTQADREARLWRREKPRMVYGRPDCGTPGQVFTVQRLRTACVNFSLKRISLGISSVPASHSEY